MVPDYGYLLNNQVTDFEATGIGPNRADGRKRPMSSMSPTILFQGGRPVLAIGASGGSRIIAAVGQVLENVYDHGLSLRAAIDEPRIFAPDVGTAPSRISWQDTSLWIPGGAAVPADARAGLAALGHVVDKTPAERGWLGVVHAIVFDGDLVGVPDRQREGTAIRVELPSSP